MYCTVAQPPNERLRPGAAVRSRCGMRHDFERVEGEGRSSRAILDAPLMRLMVSGEASVAGTRFDGKGN